MPNMIISVRLHGGGKLEQFDANGLEIPHGDFVVIEGAHGGDLGRAASTPRERTPEEAALVLKPVLRLATAADLEQDNRWQARAPEAVSKCRELAQRLNLPMKPMMAFYNLDGSHCTIYFTAETRVDFRDLVRDLRHALNTRVELRQVGPRDEARLFGAVGKCGRALCCQTFIQEFAPVSIRMAKDQELSLNPMKVSGVCGRLLCCMGYEAEYYRTVKDKAPRPGQDVSFSGGRGRVLSINALREAAVVMLANETTTEIPIAQLTWERRLRPGEKTVEEQQAAGGTPPAAATAAPAGVPAPVPPAAPDGAPDTAAPAGPVTSTGQPWQRSMHRHDRPRGDRRPPGNPPAGGNLRPGTPPGNTNVNNPSNPPGPANPGQHGPGLQDRNRPPGQPGNRRFDRDRRPNRPPNPPGAPAPGAAQAPVNAPAPVPAQTASPPPPPVNKVPPSLPTPASAPLIAPPPPAPPALPAPPA